MKNDFNKFHAAIKLATLKRADIFRIKLDNEKYWNTEETIKSADTDNRSYIVTSNQGDFKRNKKHISFSGFEK